MNQCYLSLGSNLRNPERQLHQAIHQLKKKSGIIVRRLSSFYFNEAIGRRAQPPFYNCVLEILTSLSPQQLLYACHQLENKFQRQRKIRWGARTLDIDILLYGSLQIKSHNLIIPHPRMFEREFVLLPLAQISKNPIYQLD